MAELSRRERLQPSLLDRLTDTAPEHRRESFDQQALTSQQLRQAVLRDLAWLLNTTNLAATDDLGDHPRSAASTLNFGVPGFTGMVAAAERVSSLESAIATAIRSFEPRIRPDSLRVRAREAREGQAVPTLVFDIQGELWAQPVPQQLFLETSIDIETRLAVVTDTQGARLMDPRLLRLYEGELAFVRDMGSEFAAEYPKIAARLDLGSTEVADPYVERLLEGFAFLTARIQLKMEAEFPTFTQSMLQMVYPHYLAPTPSMAVVQFRPDPAAIRGLPQGVTLPPGTVLRSLLGTQDQTNCEFRTGHAVQLPPIEISEAEYISSAAAVAALGLPEQRGVKAAIRLRLKAAGDLPFNKVALERLTVFLGGPEGSRARLYEQLVANVAAVYVRPTARPLPWQERLPERAIRGLGFEADEALLPPNPQSFDGYRLLQEYYAMPERLLFVEIDGLDRAAIRCAGGELDIVVLLTRSEPLLASGFGTEHMTLFCTPAINLFPHRSDRINIAARDAEHLIVPNRMRPLDYEVFSVQGVEGYAADGSASHAFMPFYAANDLSRNPGHRSYYSLRRQPRQLSSRSRQRGPRSSYLGHETLISLVDPDAAPLDHSLRQLGLDLLCTNRDLALSMPVGKQGTDFTISVSAPVSSIRCVVGPTAPRPCRTDGDYAWRFISHLGLNYLSLCDTDEVQGAAALRELLRLYVPSPVSLAARQLEGLLSVQSHPVVRRIPGAGPLAMGRGLEITLSMDEGSFSGAGGILLAAVLDRFFAKYVSINAFTETVLHSPERGEVMRWPMQTGRRPIL